uniref:Rho guanine nucleotide exchange factor 6/7 coiled-coil domain-containing protein n=1 Tax=Ciona savignyi TaxID=51511 RepID=H2Z1C9_CIOSA
MANSRAFITNAQGRSRHTSILEEKIIVENPENDALIEEKSLVDTVYELRDQVNSLKQEQKRMQQSLDEETRARKKLETLIRRAARDSGVIDSVTRPSSLKERKNLS